jgi:LysR family cys regulon transcriptional activator
VRLGLGVGIIASMAYHAKEDSDLVHLDASHLFKPSVTKIGFRKGMFVRGYMYDFIEQFAPHLTKTVVEKAAQSHSQEELEALFAEVKLPVH